MNSRFHFRAGNESMNSRFHFPRAGNGNLNSCFHFPARYLVARFLVTEMPIYSGNYITYIFAWLKACPTLKVLTRPSARSKEIRVPRVAPHPLPVSGFGEVWKPRGEPEASGKVTPNGRPRLKRG